MVFVAFYGRIIPQVLDKTTTIGYLREELLGDLDPIEVFEIAKVLAFETWISSVKEHVALQIGDEQIDRAAFPLAFGAEGLKSRQDLFRGECFQHLLGSQDKCL